MKRICLDNREVLQARLTQAKEEARALRPSCHLVYSTGVDEDGRIWLHWSCLKHEGASWRELVAVVRDSAIAEYAGVLEGTPCGATADDGEAGGEEMLPEELELYLA